VLPLLDLALGRPEGVFQLLDSALPLSSETLDALGLLRLEITDVPLKLLGLPELEIKRAVILCQIVLGSLEITLTLLIILLRATLLLSEDLDQLVVALVDFVELLDLLELLLVVQVELAVVVDQVLKLLLRLSEGGGEGLSVLLGALVLGFEVSALLTIVVYVAGVLSARAREVGPLRQVAGKVALACGYDSAS
jgi:hypothetical protein